MIFETIKAEGLAHFSYVFGDENAGICAVIDPRRDVEIYLDIARRNNARIAYILETHIHADFVSGSRELAARVGAPIYVGATGKYGFEHRPLHEGATLKLGSYTLETLHTPGHTPEHVCFLISGGAGSEKPWGLFTGDTLFAGEVGRPDLLGEGTEEKLSEGLYHSLHDKLLRLGDNIIIYPAHGEGSPCGASIGDRPLSTIGYERRNNPLLREQNQEKFIEQLLDSLAPAPSYYPRMKKVNAAGPAILGNLPYVKPLKAEEFKQEMEQPETIVVDIREIEAFGGAHIANSINIGLREAFPVWAGRILDETFPIWAGRMLAPKHRLLLVLPNESMLDNTLRHLLRIGYENIAGYLRQGLRSWLEAGLPFKRTLQMSVHELKDRLETGDALQVLDVRSDEEWAEEGHIPTARHIFVADLTDTTGDLNREKPVVTYCGSGYRASIAASILEQQGFQEIYNLPGSMSAWEAAGYAVEGGEAGD